MKGKTQETAAAMAGMSVRSARKWQSGPLPKEGFTGTGDRITGRSARILT